MNKYLLRGISILSGAGLVFSGLAPVNVYAASTQSSSLAYRTKVINLTGIYTGEASEETVTRGEFAKMTVLASSYKDTVTGSNTVNVFSDVSKDHENSEYIRVAARQGYMRSFLGGNFKPDEGVTLNDAAKAVLTLLGYTDEDFGIYQKGECIIFDDFTTDAKYVSFPFKVKSSAIKILTAKPDVNLRFMFEYLSYLELKSEEHKRHYISEIASLVIELPSKEKQNRIAYLMTSLDNKLALEENTRARYMDEKRYLLSQMFI